MSNFDENGNYNKTNWKTGDKITADKLNKIEDAVEIINNNDIERHKEADNRLDILEDKNKTIEEEVNNKANKEHTHNQYLTEHQSLEEYAKKDELFSKDYNDLTNKPTIPSIEGFATENYVDSKIEEIDVTNQLTDYAKKTDIPTKVSQLENDKKYLTEIPSEYITEDELNNKGYATETYVQNKIAEAQLEGEEIDLSGYATKDDLNNKVDKIEGKSLVSDIEISRLSNVFNYDDTEIKEDVEELKTSKHSHDNKEMLDAITQIKINEWNNKSNFSGNYNDLTNKPTIPTKTSELENDSKFLASVPSEYITETELNNKGYITEHQDISGKADKSELHNHNNKTVLDGITPDKVTEWDNKSTFNGDYNNLTNKPTIPSIEGLATKEEVSKNKTDMEIMMESIIRNIPVGYIDSNENNAIGAIGLPKGTYTLRYTNSDGVLSNYYDIGVIEEKKIFNRDLIKENIPPYDSTGIGVYDNTDTQVGNIPLFHFIKEKGERLYSFGVLSDVHNQTNQGAESTADLQRALTLFNGREDVEFTCISGDITETATEAEYKIYQNNKQTCSPNTPVYATPGNHDCYPSGLNLTLWKRYTGCERTYEITHGNDHFLFLGMNKWSMGSSSCTPYLKEDLEWLAEKLEAYKNERCFIFTHLFFPEYAGNLKEIYTSQNWLMGTQHDYLKDLLNYYTNTIWFSGHSHWKWYLQKYQDNANIERAGGWTVHIPSCANPIDSDGVSTRVSKGLESEGAIIDVYENYIDIRGIDLKNDMYIPTAKYRLDTTIVEVINRRCKVTLNLQNATSSNKATEVSRGESYQTTITASSSGLMDITVTMNGVNITSTAVNGNTINIDKVIGDIVIKVMVIQGYSTDLVQTSDVQLNQRWSASENAFVDQDGAIAFTVPYSDIKGRTLKLIGFTPEETGGISTWYAYDSSGTKMGRIDNLSTGKVWSSTALVDNGDGSYDIVMKPEIFMSYSTSKPLTAIPDTIYITMLTGSSSVSTTDGFRILVSDAKAEEPEQPDEPDEPIVDPDEPVEGFSTDLLQTYEVKLNQRWSNSSSAYVEQVGVIALAVPYSEIKGRALRLIGFTKATGDGSAWYAYNSAGVNLGRIAANGSGVVWDSTELVDNGDGSYDIVMKPEIFAAVNSGTPLTTEPTTIYITMRVDNSAITSFDGCKILVSDEGPTVIDPDAPIEGFSTDLLETYNINLNQRWSASENAFVDQDGAIAFTVPYSDIKGRTLKLIGFTPEETGGISTWYAYDSSGTKMGRIDNLSTGKVWSSTALVDNGDGSYDIVMKPEIFMSYSTSKPLTAIPDTIYITMLTGSSSVSTTDGFRILVSD